MFLCLPKNPTEKHIWKKQIAQLILLPSIVSRHSYVSAYAWKWYWLQPVHPFVCLYTSQRNIWTTTETRTSLPFRGSVPILFGFFFCRHCYCCLQQFHRQKINTQVKCFILLHSQERMYLWIPAWCTVVIATKALFLSSPQKAMVRPALELLVRSGSGSRNNRSLLWSWPTSPYPRLLSELQWGHGIFTSILRAKGKGQLQDVPIRAPNFNKEKKIQIHMALSSGAQTCLLSPAPHTQRRRFPCLGLYTPHPYQKVLSCYPQRPLPCRPLVASG